MKLLQNADVVNKTVFLRVDYNVPMKNGQVANNERILASKETIDFLLSKNARIVLATHLGRPDGRPNLLFSTKQIVGEIEKVLGRKVDFFSDSVGLERDEKIAGLSAGDILLLENLRFHPEEEANNPDFASQLSHGCDIFVNDAFSVSHRAHASVVGIIAKLTGYAGFGLQREIDNLNKLLSATGRPAILVLGGAKMSDKIGFLKNLLERIDILLIGGAVGNAFLLAAGNKIGKSYLEEGAKEIASEIIFQAEAKNIKLFLPEDVVVSDNIEGQEKTVKSSSQVLEGEVMVDIGPKTVSRYGELLASASTIFWNGPMGVAEKAQFADGTVGVGQAIADSGAFSVIGGGDTVASLSDEIKNRFSFVSMAGGASLEYLSGKVLPGISALE